MSVEESGGVGGAGLAASRAVDTLRSEGFAGRIILVGDEPHLPYDRPPLSKSFLRGDVSTDAVLLRPESHYGANRIGLRLGVQAVAIDRPAKRVLLDDGTALAYGALLLATGSRPKRLEIPGAKLDGVHYLRTLSDSLAIRGCMQPDMSVVVIGGGYIGLEVAATARQIGCRVAVLEAADTVLGRAAPTEVGRWLANLHLARGVDLRTGVRVAAIEGEARAEAVRLVDSTRLVADLVVVGIGVLPNAEIAAEAGIAVEDGIVVDGFGRTSDPHVFAAGDVTNHPNRHLARRLRLESWQNAQNQALAVARVMCGTAIPYDEVPWFWSDQYDCNIQMIGIPGRWDDLACRGSTGDSSFTLLFLESGRLVGAVAVNRAKDIPPARRLIESHRPVDRTRLADQNVPLRALLAA
jgi:3-phenylpropionate/trans-cinnamate dioxygenase ferredoxin reductase subunit